MRATWRYGFGKTKTSSPASSVLLVSAQLRLPPAAKSSRALRTLAALCSARVAMAATSVRIEESWSIELCSVPEMACLVAAAQEDGGSACWWARRAARAGGRRASQRGGAADQRRRWRRRTEASRQAGGQETRSLPAHPRAPSPPGLLQLVDLGVVGDDVQHVLDVQQLAVAQHVQDRAHPAPRPRLALDQVASDAQPQLLLQRGRGQRGAGARGDGNFAEETTHASRLPHHPPPSLPLSLPPTLHPCPRRACSASPGAADATSLARSIDTHSALSTASM